MSGLVWLLLWGAIFYFMMRFGCGSHMVHGGHGGQGGHGGHSGHGSESDERDSHRTHGSAASSTTDPVCGMQVASDAGYSRIYEKREYRFCSRNCLDQFDREPQKFTR